MPTALISGINGLGLVSLTIHSYDNPHEKNNHPRQNL